MITLMIDDQEIQTAPGRSILDACRENGIVIPTLCYHPALEPFGGCRLCVVELAAAPPRKSRLVAACVYPCEAGAVIYTNSEMVRRNRRITVELLMASASHTPEIQALAQELGISQVRFKLPEAHDCILCERCVRACREIVHVSAISVIRRGISKKVSTPFQVASSRCISCGTCVLICPTGAFKLTDVNGRLSELAGPAYSRRYYRVGAELDLRPDFVQDVIGLLGKNDNPED